MTVYNNNNAKRFRRGALILASAVCLWPAASALAALEEPFSYPEKEHARISYAELPRTGVTTEEMQALADRMKELASGEGNAEAVKETCLEMIREYDRQMVQVTLLMNESASDTTDQALSDASEEADARISDVYDIMMDGMKAAAGSSYKDDLSECFPDDSWVPYILSYEPYSEEELGNRSEAGSLVMDYYEDSGYDVSAWVDGEEWSFEKYLETEDMTEEQEEKVLTALYQAENEILGEYYLKLLKTRTETARLAGYESYTGYAYEAVYDRDYEPEEIRSLQASVKEVIAPLYKALTEVRDDMETSDLATLGDGDMEQVLSDLRPQIGAVSPFLEEAFDYLQTYKTYDADTSSLKRDMSYTIELPYYGSAMIFSKMSGGCEDYRTMIHEFGHYNALFHYPENSMFTYSVSDVDEVQSQGLELLFNSRWKEIFGEETGAYMEINTLTEILASVLSGMAMDEFEQTVYDNPDMTLPEINALMKELMIGYGLYTSEADVYSWVETTHLFEQPFYYISYATSALAAFEIWMEYQDNPDLAVRKYLEITNYHGEYYFLDTLELCGIPDPLKEEEIRRIAAYLEEYLELEELEDAA